MVVYSTPKLLKSLLPQERGYTLSLDQNSCRWRAEADGFLLPSIAFGPRSGNNRLESLKQMLDVIWETHGGDRPPSAHVEAIPWAAWGGVLDARIEQPKVYSR